MLKIKMGMRRSGKKHKTVIFLVAVMALSWTVSALAEDIFSRAQALFLQKKYWQAIEECTDVIKKNSSNKEVLAEANYLAGASYVNLFDFLSAKKSFQAVVDKYKETLYFEDAALALGDVEFVQENLYEASKSYTEFLLTKPSNRRLATLYFRLAEVSAKLGKKEEKDKYLGMLQREFPGSFDARDAQRLKRTGNFYTVQVGAFTNFENADNFVDELKAKGYEVYSILCLLSGKKLCRIRVGRFSSEKEAEGLKSRLERDGYFAKIFPVEN